MSTCLFSDLDYEIDRLPVDAEGLARIEGATVRSDGLMFLVDF